MFSAAPAYPRQRPEYRGLVDASLRGTEEQQRRRLLNGRFTATSFGDWSGGRNRVDAGRAIHRVSRSLRRGSLGPVQFFLGGGLCPIPAVNATPGRAHACFSRTRESRAGAPRRKPRSRRCSRRRARRCGIQHDIVADASSRNLPAYYDWPKIPSRILADRSAWPGKIGRASVTPRWQNDDFAGARRGLSSPARSRQPRSASPHRDSPGAPRPDAAACAHTRRSRNRMALPRVRGPGCLDCRSPQPRGQASDIVSTRTVSAHSIAGGPWSAQRYCARENHRAGPPARPATIARVDVRVAATDISERDLDADAALS